MPTTAPSVEAASPPSSSLGPEQLGPGVAELARSHQGRTTVPGRPRDRIAPRLARAEAVLERTYRVLADEAHSGALVTPEAEWILDNYYVVVDESASVREDLTPAFYRRLPQFADGPLRGLPRIYELVCYVAAALDNDVTPEALTESVRQYQLIEPLRLAELWALPIVVRLVAVERLSARAAEMCAGREGIRRVERWIEQAIEHPDTPLSLDEAAALPIAALVYLDARVRETPNATLPKLWLDRQFERHGMTREDAARDVVQAQTQRQVSIRNAVQTLRTTATVDWAAFVEEASLVERVLQLDPAGIYGRMDRATRSRYRDRVERLARRSPLSEFGVAETLVKRAATASEAEPLARHIGFYLFDEGRADAEASLRYRVPLSERARRGAVRHPTASYLGLVAFIWLASLVTLWAAVAGASVGVRLLTLSLVALPALDVAVMLVNGGLTRTMPPRILPKLSFDEGIPPEARTLVVVPTLLMSPADAVDQVAEFEARALANSDPGLRFALLSDFPDAVAETMPGDRATLDAAAAAVRALNARHVARSHAGRRRSRAFAGDRFFLLHRDRRWNASEGVWMGWERKRGKLEDLNRILLNPEGPSAFSTIVGDFAGTLAEGPFRYVVTLDADTTLPPRTARALAEAAAHPLNRAVVDPVLGRVVRGYGVLQPRIAIHPEGAGRTAFARLYSGRVGVDPYSTAASDVYQDLFGEGIYAGKGLYDVAAFEAVLGGVLPENRVLSHDLLEGSYARAAYLSDVVLYDDYPSTYLTFSKRLHRWIRGDWQIAAWLGRRVPGQGGRRSNPLSVVARWRIFDNLRRSLTPPALGALLIAGWTVLPGSPWTWTALALSALAFPYLVGIPDTLARRPRHAAWGLHLWRVGQDALASLSQAMLAFATLPHQALLATDAIARTLGRLITQRRLLEWTTAKHIERTTTIDAHATLRAFRGALVLAISTGVLAVWLRPASAPVVLIAVAAWLAAPFAMARLSRLAVRKAPELTAADRARLRRVARRTWRYFERYAGADSGWLPPDNVQFEPARPPATRTSPTNIGLGLLAAQAACDLGYLPRSVLLARLRGALDALARLDRFRGHIYNWIRVPDGEPLAPRYVSTVDSGNLAVSLVALGQALRETGMARWPDPAFAEGLRDTLGVVETLAVTEGVAGTLAEPMAHLLTALSGDPPVTLTDWHVHLQVLRPIASDLARRTLPDDAHDRSVLDDWRHQPLQQIERLNNELDAGTGGALGHEPLPASIDTASSWTALHDALARQSAKGKAFQRALAQIDAWLGEADLLADLCEAEVADMDFRFLYVTQKRLFAIGYNADRAALDTSTYDLLASEARLASFLAVARGAVPTEHWFHLGRRLVALRSRTSGSDRALASWSGTLFEYLMPLLVMRRFPGSLLDETYRAVVAWQRQHGRRRRAPWGVSESAYYQLGIDLDYQYRAFGTPLLGLRRGLSDDYVAAPYATALALTIDPVAAVDNLDALARIGAYGPLGFFEAVDFTPARLNGAGPAIVQTYMAHHQGMALVALANAVQGDRFVRRFHADPYVAAHSLLLQERVPPPVRLAELHPLEVEQEPSEDQAVEYFVEHVPRVALDEPVPRVALLSNGRLSTLITAAGSGGTRLGDIHLTRWRPDRVRDADGVAFYVRDLDRGSVWSAGHQPVQRPADRYDVWFHPGMVEAARVDDRIETYTEVAVSPEDDIELRRYTLTNYADEPRRLEVTAFAEVALADPRADAAHPAFSKLFVHTEALPEYGALLAHRRPRSRDEPSLWMVAALTVERDTNGRPAGVGRLSVETDRLRFIGRGRSAAAPEALDAPGALSGTTGFVLDPCVALRQTVTLAPNGKAHVTMAIGGGPNRDETVRLAARYTATAAIERAFRLATAYGLVEQGHLGLDGPSARRAQDLAGALLYGDPSRRAPASVLLANRSQQSGLWAYGISGDLPLVVVRVQGDEATATAPFLLRAHAFWRARGVAADLVFLYEHPPSYADAVRDALVETVEASPSAGRLHQPGGGVFIRAEADIPPTDRALLLSAARVVIGYDKEPEPPRRRAPGDPPARRFVSARSKPLPPDSDLPPSEPLADENGLGGFADDGRAYVIRLVPDADGRPVLPPRPWSNVLANAAAGCLVTERGIGSTWSENSRENRLTPWSNDPAEDPPSEAFWVRDDDAGTFWSALPGPSPSGAAYQTSHTFGETTVRHRYDGLDHETTVLVPPKDGVRLMRLRLTNRSGRTRRLTAVWYARLVLGVRAAESSPFVVTTYDTAPPHEGQRTITARNAYNGEFSNRVALATVQCPTARAIHGTTDRAGFLGRHGALSHPTALTHGTPLDGADGPGLDPCAAFAVDLVLAPDAEADVVSLLGEGANDDEVHALTESYAALGAFDAARGDTRSFWADTLNRIHIQTPSPAIDRMVNGWAPYQNLACRLWGRTAFYQSGGAFGFRDQLQDALALVAVRPDLTRAQLLRHAARQFPEGDVLHWWHPPTGRGVRTRFSDDRVWLPYAVATYLAATGDEGVLDVAVPFVDARVLAQDEDEAYLAPRLTTETASLYEHAARALDIACTQGAHGLPLMGAGDWNDGMNRVGHEGRGESVWLACFIALVASRFAPICRSRGDDIRADRLEAYGSAMAEAVNGPGWDGGWYRRAFYDDGTPLGSAAGDECQIDGLVQAWAILAKLAPSDRAELALDAIEAQLIDHDAGVVRLLAPPFDRTAHDPGYIKGYPPGVRENGGQYTHAALWVVQALAEAGRTERAGVLLEALSPVSHTRDPDDVGRYQAEPYAVAADVYGVAPYVGRAGWTWYTGSAGWYVRVAVETILGLRLDSGKALVLQPRLPVSWPSARVTWRSPERGCTYTVQIENPERRAGDIVQAWVDGAAMTVEASALRVDLTPGDHAVRLVLGSRPEGRQMITPARVK